VAIFLPSGEIERVRLELGLLTSVLRKLLVRAFHVLLRHVLPRLELRIATVVDLDVLDNATVLNLSVRRLDEAKLVDPREARKGRDETDVRTFRRLDRANASVVGRVNVADLKSGAFA